MVVSLSIVVAWLSRKEDSNGGEAAGGVEVLLEVLTTPRSCSNNSTIQALFHIVSNNNFQKTQILPPRMTH